MINRAGEDSFSPVFLCINYNHFCNETSIQYIHFYFMKYFISYLMKNFKYGTLTICKDEIGGDVMREPLEVFFSYAHEDEEYRNRLEIALGTLKREKLITGWHDRKTPPRIQDRWDSTVATGWHRQGHRESSLWR